MTTMGQLIAALYSKYQQQLRDDELAAVATQVALDELLVERTDRKRGAGRKAA